MDYQQALAQALKAGLGTDQTNMVALRGSADPIDNRLLAPFEHQQFARQATQQNPLLGLGVGVLAPGYYLAKKLGYDQANATPADIDQVFGAWQGIAQGLKGK